MEKNDKIVIQDGGVEDVRRSEEVYRQVRGYVIDAQSKVCRAVNSAMVEAYWEIGKTLFEVCGENDRATYGKQILQYIAKRLSQEFGKSFDVTNLRKMRQFYRVFPIRDALRLELSWTHYRLLMKVEDAQARFLFGRIDKIGLEFASTGTSNQHVLLSAASCQ